jgi:ectoine hydroxylase-related dioxygenase (phytanoyl-CoA dioxygenase family)
LARASSSPTARHAALLDAVEDVLGPDILLWDSGYVIQEPGDTRHVAWHQDLTYWGLSSDALVTAWVALSRSDRRTGGMRFIPGSHGQGKLSHRDTYSPDNILHRGQEIAGVDEGRAVEIELAPGQASLHHGWVMHASGANPSPDRRIGLTLQYAAPSVRQTVGEGESATLVRGAGRYGHFRAEPKCERDFAPEAIAFQEAVERLKRAVYDSA